jgi:hypothetical protein
MLSEKTYRIDLSLKINFAFGVLQIVKCPPVGWWVMDLSWTYAVISTNHSTGGIPFAKGLTKFRILYNTCMGSSLLPPGY